jgi:hypothetical protein
MRPRGILMLLACFTSLAVFSQKENFDLASYSPLKGWKKQPTANFVQFTKEDASGNFCLITLYKSMVASDDPKNNFDDSWEALAKEPLGIASAPEMQPAAAEDGWEVRSGVAAFDKDGTKGIALLITSTGYSKLMNLLILTNTDKFEKEISAFTESIVLKKPAGTTNTNATKPPVTTTPSVALKTTFQFNTTTFDDGWVSTVQEDWVAVEKGAMKVLIHHPNKKADEYNPVLLNGLKTAWDILVAPRYSNASGMEFKPVSNWESIEYAEATMQDNLTGKKVFVVLFKKNYSGGNGRYLEFIAPDKKTFEQQFGPYKQEPFGWEKMEAMANYNKFAVAPSDLSGKWTNNFTGLTQYVNVNTGLSAGATSHASHQFFQFGAGSTYKWELTVGSGVVGNIKFQNVKSNGKFKVPNNWQVYFSDIEGKPRTYNVQFTCIKGSRLLWIDGIAYGKAE